VVLVAVKGASGGLGWCFGRVRASPEPCRAAAEGGQGRAGGPPGGAALTAPVDRREHNGSREPRQGLSTRELLVLRDFLS